MKISPKSVFNQILPSGEELWQIGKAEMQTIEIEPGRHIDVPFFDPRFTKDPEETLLNDSEFRTRSGRLIGRQALHEFELDGMSYLSRVLLPNEADRTENDLTILDSTAWFTTIDGYVGDRDAKLVIDNSVPLVSIGAANSAPPESLIRSVCHAPKAAYNSRKLSLAYSAEVEQKIFTTLAERYDLPRQILKIGDSRGANISLGQYAYAGTYGSEIIGFDNKGRCAPDKIELKDLGEVASWLGATVLGGVAVSACLLSKGRSDLLTGTASLDPRFVATSLTGTLRTLTGGETGQMIDWVPYSAHGHDLQYGLDSLAKHEYVDQLWHRHPNVVRKAVLSGTHAALLHPLAHAGQRLRVSQTVREFHTTAGSTELMNWENIYGKESLHVNLVA